MPYIKRCFWLGANAAPVPVHFIMCRAWQRFKDLDKNLTYGKILLIVESFHPESVWDPGWLSRILIFYYPGSNNNKKEESEQIFCHTLGSHTFHKIEKLTKKF